MKKDVMDFIKSKMKPMKASSVEVEMESESEDVNEVEVMAEELITAIHENDAKAVIETLKAILEQIKE